MSTLLRQQWTIKKVVCYLLYQLVAKHLPSQIPVVGMCFHKFRSLICRPLFRASAKTVWVGQGASFGSGAAVIMRDQANIGERAELRGGYATITIGAHVMMGRHCTIIAQNHHYLEEGYDGVVGEDVTIDDFAWLGDHVIVLPGVRIGKHAIIGAGAVVPKDIPDYAIAAGNPAAVKKYRKNAEQTNGD